MLWKIITIFLLCVFLAQMALLTVDGQNICFDYKSAHAKAMDAFDAEEKATPIPFQSDAIVESEVEQDDL